MQREKLEEAMAIAEQFHRRGDRLIAADEKAKGSTYPNSPFFGSKESGDVRRISMELTRALADLRRP